MRSAAIIGTGIAGMLTAHGLLKKGFRVTVYSDRTGEQWLTQSKPTGTAARFDRSLRFDRELGLNHWDRPETAMQGVSLAFCLKPRNPLVTLTGRIQAPCRAIDVRLLSARWMQDFVERGGRLVIEPVDLARLDQIASEHDLTIVAAGRAQLAQLFPRNEERSVYSGPQRKLCLLVTRGGRMGFDRVPFLPVRFNLFATAGEAFWVPFWHKDHGPTWNLLFEAKPGGPMDQFDGCKSGEEALAVAKKVIRELCPWDADWAEPMTLADPHGWLIGAVPPGVRAPVGRLPSGRVVTGVGDTLMSLDPIGGQGANNGTRMARNLVEAAAARGDAPFDAAWMESTFEQYWREEGSHIVRFNNILLEPLSAAGRSMLLSQYGSDGLSDTPAQRIADQVAENFNDPHLITDGFVDDAAARKVIAGAGGRWPWSFMRGGLGVARGQARQAVGLQPRHPAHV
ncbi:MAG: NAD(P)-binding protein [Deltaproteobacteria bacterium]|nr:NAD(P)-binding protein [Deltaproteobacteria bacterium]